MQEMRKKSKAELLEIYSRGPDGTNTTMPSIPRKRNMHAENEFDLEGAPEALQAFGSGYVHGGTFGYAPKIIGGAGAAVLPYVRPDLFGESTYKDLYKELRDTARQQDQELAANRPGAHFAGSVAGAAGPMTRIGKLGGKLAPGASKVLPAVGTKKRAALSGFGWGGLQGFGESDKGEVGSIGLGNVLDAAGFATTSAIAGAGLQSLFNNAFGKLTPEATKALERGQAYQDVNIPYRKSQLTLNPQDAAKEAEYLAGKHGNTNETLMRNHMGKQEEAYHDLVRNARNWGGEKFIEKGRHLGEAVDVVAMQAKKEQKAASANYDKAFANDVTLASEDFQSLPLQIERALKKVDLDQDIVPQAYLYLKKLGNKFKKQESGLDLNTKVTSTEGSIIKSGRETVKTISTTTPTKRISTDETRIITKEPNRKITDIERNKHVTPELEEVTLNGIERWRQTLGKALEKAKKDGNGNEVNAMIKIRDMVDAHVDDLPEIAPFKTARQVYRQHMDEYHTDNPKELGKRFIQDVVKNRAHYTDEMIADMVLGTSISGFDKGTAHIVYELKKNLSPMDFNKIKLEAADKLVSPLLQGKKGSLDAYIANLQNVRKQYPTLMKHLFTPKEMAALEYLGHIGKQVLAHPKGLAGNSLKEKSVKSALWLLGKKFPFIGGLIEGAQDIASRPQLNQEAILNTIRKEGMVRGMPAPGAQQSAASALLRKQPPKEKAEEPKARTMAEMRTLSKDELLRIYTGVK